MPSTSPGPIDPEKIPRKYRKKCAVCRKWFLINQEEVRKEGIGRSGSTRAQGYQTRCKRCKTASQHARQQADPIKRIKHHFNTRMDMQLKPLRPKTLTADMEKYLGYKILHLKRKLSQQCQEDYGMTIKQALEAGYHIDHVRPLSSFKVIVEAKPGQRKPGETQPGPMIDWDEFRRCWDPSNLKVITAEENLSKGTTWEGKT